MAHIYSARDEGKKSHKALKTFNEDFFFFKAILLQNGPCSSCLLY